MQHYRDVVQDRSGNVIGGAIVTVIDHLSGQSAPLYSDANGSIPLTSVITDTNGTFSFYVDSGRYDITVSKNGIVLSSVSDVFITVTADYPTAMDSTTAQAGTSTTAQTVSASVLKAGIDANANVVKTYASVSAIPAGFVGTARVGTDLYVGDGTNLSKYSADTKVASFAVFDGVSGKATYPTTFILQTDGDYIDFVAKLDEQQGTVACLAMFGVFGTNQNYISPDPTPGLFSIRENTGAAKTISYTQNPYEWQRYRVTQTNATTWTLTINGVAAGTAVRADVLKIDNIGSGYTGNYCRFSLKEVTISTSITGTSRVANASTDLPKKTTSVAGVTYQTISYYDNNLILIKNAVSPSISIYQPQLNSTKYLKYIYENTVDAVKAGDVWRIHYLYIATPIEFPFIWDNTRLITTGGEWENAVRINADDDYFGGTTHGKDLKINNTMVIDNFSVDLSSFLMAGAFDVVFTQTSNCYKKVAGNYTAVNCAISNRTWRFNSEGVNLKNKVTWLTSEVISEAFLTMCPILRSDVNGNITQWGLLGIPPTLTNISTAGFSMLKTNGTDVEIYGDMSGVDIKVSAITGWGSGSLSWIDNSVTYNKIYMNFSPNGESNYTTTINEVFNSECQIISRLTI